MLNLKFNSNFDDDYESYFADEVQTHQGTLASIFKKNQRYVMREIKLNTKTEEKTDISEIPPVKCEEEIQFNSKLTWLAAPSLEKKEDLTSSFQDEYPSLSLVNNTTCPKIRDGFKCSKTHCQFAHPEIEDVQKIVSTMRSLKKRVVKDVLKVITPDDEEKIKPSRGGEQHATKSRGREAKNQDVKPKSKPREMKDKSKLCKFMQGCKFKSTCKFAHTENELVLNDCQFGGRCRFVKNVDGKYMNNNGKCLFLHPRETKTMYISRTK